MKAKKYNKGGKFPDLNKDGKITKADILKGRGVFKEGGKIPGPFSMTKKEEDKAAVDVLKGDKKFVKKVKRDEKKTQRTINRKGRGAEGLAKLQKQLRAKAKRKRKKENRQQKRSNKRSARQLGRQLMAKRVGKALGRGNSISAKEAGCQGAGCGAYE
jgi:carbon monoxide dehydrogenase subunit G